METNEFKFERVMIIDDTKIDRYVATFMLKKNSFAREIMEFDMATKAIVFLEENQNNPEKLPQVILLDIRMPEMDGFQFLERLELLPQSLKQSCCIIMVSSSLDPEDLERVEKSNIAKKLINKPLSEAKLKEIEELFFSMNLQINSIGVTIE